MVQAGSFDCDKVVFGNPSIPVVLQDVQSVVGVQQLTKSVLVDDVRIIRAFEDARCYPWLKLV